MVRRVGTRVRQAVEQYLNTNGLSKRLEGFNWEYNLVQSPQVNAWCMPGGKIVVYSGILPYTQNEAGLATVMGHEVSHAIAEHSNERMSEGLVANGLLQVGQAYLGSRRSRVQLLGIADAGGWCWVARCLSGRSGPAPQPERRSRKPITWV